jgi:release factor glutamine methyltransferase
LRAGSPAAAELAHRISVGARVLAARQELRDAGLTRETADLDARLLAQHLLGWTTERFLISTHMPEPDGFGPAYAALIARRRAREPLAYIVGHREFWGLEMAVTPAVLVPRPETELLVESVLEYFPESGAPIAILDACTGSGCVAIAIARARPSARIVATDISDAALAVARHNAGRHGVGDRVQLVRADLLRGLAGPFDAVVANPPYVPWCDRAALDSEVARHEPAIAIFAGEDGMSAIEQLVPQASGLLRKSGALMFEFGFGQDSAVAAVIDATPDLTLVALRSDLQGIPRVAVATREVRRSEHDGPSTTGRASSAPTTTERP